jgi:predicted ATPase/DNA-binding CsgD family transcriptional regulator
MPGQPSTERNLPVPLTSLVGRSRELDRIAETLRKARLVTITGPGGVGKTRLALETAHRQLGRRPGGVWLVDLAASPEQLDVAAETARALGVGSKAGTTPTDALRGYLADRDLMIVLDNCEHVIDASAELVDAVLTTCTQVRVLATSREPLGVDGETVWRLEPLAADDARRLFIERARQRRPEFIPSADLDATIVALCERLDHLPLAIELAAARIGVMSPAEILAALDKRLDTLAHGSRVAPARHRTIRAAVEWSYDLLEPDEQRAFRSLAVFVGGFDADAAIAVSPGLTLDGFARLVEKSIVAVGESPSGRTRYRLLEAVRQLAHERIVAAGELDAARDRHLAHFSVPSEGEPDGWPSTTAVAVLDELEDDYGNVRAAIEWAAASDPCAGSRLLFARRDLFLLLGQADGRRLAVQLLERCPTRDRHRVLVQITAGLLGMMVADSGAAKDALEAARKLSVQLGEPALEGWALFFQGLTETLFGAIEPAREHLERARSLLHESGARAGEGTSIAALGLTFLATGEAPRAKELVEDALSMQVAADYSWGQGQAHIYLGIIADATGADPAGAASHYRQAVDCLRPYRGPLLPMAVIGQAGVLGRRDPEVALKVAAAAHALRAQSGGDFPPLFRQRAEQVRVTAEAALGTEAPRIWAEGERLGADEAIALAFGTAKPRAAAPAGLSPREFEVAGLVAKGLSNKAIAARLQLSVRTVEDHVRHALAKTGLDNRTQLATWASERVP